MRRKSSIGRIPTALVLLLSGSAQVVAQTADAVAPAAPIAAPGPAARPTSPKLPPAVVAKYKADPAALLAAYPNGGRAMATMAKALILADPSLVGPLMAAAKNATPAQMSAIGAGVAQAATLIAAVNPEMAAQIQLAVTQSGPPGVASAFAAASSNTASAASVTTGTGGLMPTPTPSPSTAASGSTDATAEPSPSPTTAATAFTTAGSSAAAPTGGLTSATTQSTSPSKSSL